MGLELPLLDYRGSRFGWMPVVWQLQIPSEGLDLEMTGHGRWCGRGDSAAAI